MPSLSSPSHRRLLQRAGAIGGAAAAAVLLVTPTAHGEIVSKLPGTSGLPFPAQLVDASADGRYVLLRVTGTAPAPAPPGPEADLDALGPYVVRDRVADTTTPLVVRAEPGAAPITAELTDISDDGDRVLVRGQAPALKSFTGVVAPGEPTAVFDRSEGRLLKIPTSPDAPSGGANMAWLSGDGTQVLFVTARPVPNDAPERRVVRGPVGGAGTLVTDLPRLVYVRPTADLQTVVYMRVARTALRPDPEPGRIDRFDGLVVGAIEGAGDPRVLFETSYRERRDPAAVYGCVNSQSVLSERTEADAPLVSPQGARIAWRQWGPTPGAVRLVVRSAAGEFSSLTAAGGNGYPAIGAFGDGNQSLFGAPELATAHQQLVKGETELIASAEAPAWATTTQGSTRYTEATPFTGAPVPEPRPLSLTDEPVDTADRASAVTWYSCPPAPATAPMGTIDQYVNLRLITPYYSTRNGIGYANVFLAPSDQVRQAASVTAELTWFGIPYWRSTATRSTTMVFPKPLWAIPMKLKITVRPRAVAGQPTPAPLVQTTTIYTTNVR